MPTLEERRELRLARQRAQLERATQRRDARAAKERAEAERAAERKLAARIKKTPADYLGAWQKPHTTEPPNDALLCTSCGQLFRDLTCWWAHRLHLETRIERCALAYELGAAQWERAASGTWSLGLQASRMATANISRSARASIERLATARSEREAFELGKPVQLHFPARPAKPIQTWIEPPPDGTLDNDPTDAENENTRSPEAISTEVS